jgi:5-oxoprolinase (ATP-hydrolysing) subunit C
MFTFIDRGMARFVSGPVYGKQDIGFSPSGAMDLFSMMTGNLLLGNPADTESLEIVLLPPKIEFQTVTMFVLTGASWEADLVSPGGKREVEHAKVYFASKGDILSFGDVKYGFRTYLCYKDGMDMGRIGHLRKPFYEIAHWPDKDNQIRVIEGPEHRFLKNPGIFFENRWSVSTQSNDIGIRLIGPPMSCDMPGMVSESVSDGTVQLSPAGPIILMKNRPTIGGYPRIFNVISADVDLLAQYGPGNTLHFGEVDIEEAIKITRQKQGDIDAFMSEQGD